MNVVCFNSSHIEEKMIGSIFFKSKQEFLKNVCLKVFLIIHGVHPPSPCKGRLAKLIPHTTNACCQIMVMGLSLLLMNAEAFAVSTEHPHGGPFGVEFKSDRFGLKI